MNTESDDLRNAIDCHGVEKELERTKDDLARFTYARSSWERQERGRLEDRLRKLENMMRPH